MILAFDTYYYEDKAKTVCIQFENWTSASPSKIYSEILNGIDDYVPGEFYRRELPCILSLLKQIDITSAEAIIIDGYVYIDDQKKPGLGGHLYDALLQETPVIGVAKSNFKTLDKQKQILLRGTSKNPLYITSVGMNINLASQNIRSMAGPNRIPTLLKTLDIQTKISED